MEIDGTPALDLPPSPVAAVRRFREAERGVSRAGIAFEAEIEEA